MKSVLPLGLLVVLGAAVAIAVTTAPAAGDDPAPAVAAATVTVTVTRKVDARVQGKTAAWWSRRAVQARKDANARGRTIRVQRADLRRHWQPTAEHVIALAAIAYRQSSATLYRKASCETGRTFNPFALNPSGAGGWFQFLPSTWAGTPYAAFSRFDPLAASLAASWMHDQGRGGEWVCQ